jgi:hypothetical protein
MDDDTQVTENKPTLNTQDTSTISSDSNEEESSQRNILIGVLVGVILIIVLIIAAIYGLLLPTTDTAKIRDLFIIFMGFESLLIGLALVILMVQLARLINLLQNEIKPILDSTNETVSTLRGTTAFLSENLVGPVIKMNEYLAGLSQFMQILGLARKRPKS